MTGMWADPVVGLPEWSLLGAGSRWGLYSRFGQATPRGSGAFTVHRHDHWMFAGTDLRYGDLLGGLAPRIDVIERDGRNLWRLQAGPLGESRARDVCAALKSRGEACLLVRG